MDFFNRVWQLKLQLDNGSTHIYEKLTREDDGFAVSFSCQAVVNGIPGGGDLTITGLPDDMISYLGTNYETQSGKLKDSLVEFSAGYDGNLSLLMLGNIYQTTMNFTQPAHSINLKIMTGLMTSQLHSFSSVSMGGTTTLRDVVANLANKMKLTLDIDHKLTNLVIGDYSFQGSPLKQLDQLRIQHPDVTFTADKTSLIVKYKQAKGTQVRYKLSPDSGLLGTPQPSPMGVIINTYLLGNLNISDFIELETIKLPQMNGIYQIQQINHQGDSRGSAWKTQLTCTRGSLFYS